MHSCAATIHSIILYGVCLAYLALLIIVYLQGVRRYNRKIPHNYLICDVLSTASDAVAPASV